MNHLEPNMTGSAYQQDNSQVTTVAQNDKPSYTDKIAMIDTESMKSIDRREKMQRSIKVIENQEIGNIKIPQKVFF